MKFNLQTILLVVFGFFILFGVAVFAGYINLGSSSSSTTTPTGTAIFWGTMDAEKVKIFLDSIMTKDQKYKISYIQKDPNTYEQELIQALASGKGPDVFMVTPEIFWRQRDKMYPIPYQNLPLQTFNATYMDIAQVYLGTTGIWALPLFVDPLVGYWNKDIFAGEGMASPPALWKDFPALAKKLSIVSNDFTITRSTVGMGEFKNVNHAKDIMSLLFFQSGENITEIDSITGKLITRIGSKGFQNGQPADASVSLSFYTQFANPSNRDTYTWNKLFTSDKDQFLAGNLAYYIGLGSELLTLRKTNPNLNFDITMIPEPSVTGTKTTVGSLFGLAISKQSTNIPLAYYVVSQLTTMNNSSALITALSKSGLTLAPVRRDLIPTDSTNAYAKTLYNSALIARTWIDPDAIFTNQLYEDMVNDVLSGKTSSVGSISNFRNKLTAFLKQTEGK
jgi:ABC-type glycerol-3-phosphate transport system substrate-binding protein